MVRTGDQQVHLRQQRRLGEGTDHHEPGHRHEVLRQLTAEASPPPCGRWSHRGGGIIGSQRGPGPTCYGCPGLLCCPTLARRDRAHHSHRDTTRGPASRREPTSDASGNGYGARGEAAWPHARLDLTRLRGESRTGPHITSLRIPAYEPKWLLLCELRARPDRIDTHQPRRAVGGGWLRLQGRLSDHQRPAFKTSVPPDITPLYDRCMRRAATASSPIARSSSPATCASRGRWGDTLPRRASPGYDPLDTMTGIFAVPLSWLLPILLRRALAIGWRPDQTPRGQPPMTKAPGRPRGLHSRSMYWSGRDDSNVRPPEPHSGALPGCATPRQNGQSIRGPETRSMTCRGCREPDNCCTQWALRPAASLATDSNCCWTVICACARHALGSAGTRSADLARARRPARHSWPMARGRPVAGRRET